MKIVRLILVMCFGIVFSSCEKNSSEDKACFEIDLNHKTIYPLQGKWIFKGFNHKNSSVEECKPEQLRVMNIQFNRSNKFTGISSCNSLVGYYTTIAPDSIKLDSIVSTYVACVDNESTLWEQKYLDALSEVSTYKISGNGLILSTTANLKMIFTVNSN